MYITYSVPKSQPVWLNLSALTTKHRVVKFRDEREEGKDGYNPVLIA